MTQPAACIPNIGAAQIERRRQSGWIALGVAIAIGLVLFLIGAPWWSRLALFLPLWAAGIGLFQAQEKT